MNPSSSGFHAEKTSMAFTYTCLNSFISTSTRSSKMPIMPFTK
uniref:Uncharacterized protein n=1 Tax=Anguilla anguilla TaxID=7936 RepID=A0A0E9WFG8_ANGAN